MRWSASILTLSVILGLFVLNVAASPISKQKPVLLAPHKVQQHRIVPHKGKINTDVRSPHAPGQQSRALPGLSKKPWQKAFRWIKGKLKPKSETLEIDLSAEMSESPVAGPSTHLPPVTHNSAPPPHSAPLAHNAQIGHAPAGAQHSGKHDPPVILQAPPAPRPRPQKPGRHGTNWVQGNAPPTSIPGPNNHHVKNGHGHGHSNDGHSSVNTEGLPHRLPTPPPAYQLIDPQRPVTPEDGHAHNAP